MAVTSGWTKFKLLMWKNWILQKRHKIRTVVEILLPALFVLLLVGVRYLADPVMAPLLIYDEFKPSYMKELTTNYCTDRVLLSYSPNSPVVAQLLRDSAKYTLSENTYPHDVNFDQYLTKCFGGGFPTDTDDKLEWLLDKVFSFAGYQNALQLELELSNPTKNDSSYCGIQFDDSLQDLDNPGLWPIHTNLTIRFPAQLRYAVQIDKMFNWQTNVMYPLFSLPGAREPNKNMGGNPSYMTEGFMPIAHSILHQITKLKSGSTKIPELFIQRYPHPEQLNDGLLLALESLITFVILLSLYYTCINTVKAIAVEKERQLKEVLKVMGLSNWLHWAAWFVKTFSFLMISIAIIVLLLKLEMYTSDKGLTGYSIITNTPWHLILFFLIIYTMTSICYFFMISTFFAKANTASIIAGMVWIFSYFPYSILSANSSLPSVATRISACLASNTAMAYGFQIILRSEATSKGLQWSDIFSPVSVDDPIMFGYILLMLVLDAFIYLIIALYVEQVFPGSYGVPQPWYFPVTKQYWTSSSTKSTEDESYEYDESISDKIQADPKGLDVGINIINLSKIFNDKIAVDKLSLKIFQDQITVLLGHNGAGKTTTISMLTGMFPPTSGTANIAGYDLRKNITGVRDSLSICPQHNVLFSDLTVEEHIYFFACLKGVSGKALKDQVDKYIKLLGLEDKRNLISSGLSGGMQRRLSIGTALCGNSKVVLLDEPTSGMDPAARRQLWSLLHQEKTGRTIILTTHFMDEAEILGERVAILSEGKLRCVGSPFYLKKKFGIGYRLIGVRQPISLGAERPSYTPIINLLRKYVPEVKIYSDIGSEVSFVLPESSSGQFQPMLKDLEDNQHLLGLISFGLSAPTLEEVFMRVGADIDNNIHSDPDSDENNGPIIDGSNMPASSLIVYSGMKLIWSHWKAMLLKKTLVGIRSWRLFLLHVVIPFIFVGFGKISLGMWEYPDQLPSKNLELSFGYQDSVTFLNSNGTLTGNDLLIKEAYAKYFTDAAIDTMKLVDINNKDMSEHYLQTAVNDMQSMRIRNLIGSTVGQDKITAWFSNFAIHDLPASVVLAHKAIMDVVTDYNASFTLINRPMPFKIEASLETVVFTNDSFMIAYNIGIGMSIISALFIFYYIKENTTRSKLLQMASGVSPFTLWTSALFVDFMWFIIIIIVLCCTLLGFQFDGYSTAEEQGRVIIALLVFGWAMLPLQYLASTMFKTPASGFSKATILYMLTGIAPFITLQVLYTPGFDLEDTAEKIHKIVLIFPHYSIIMALKNLHQTSDTLKTCLAACDIYNLGEGCTQQTLCVNPVIPLKMCCLSDYPYFEWENPGIGANITYMAIVGLVVFILVLAREYKIINYIYSPRCPKPPPINAAIEDSDVAAEREQISQVAQLDYYKYNLLCKDLSRYYGKFLAVDQLSIGVKDGECFGLLGINGAGKTSTFKMLTGDLRISTGEAWVKGSSVNKDMKSVYKNIGYCPQFDALLDELTGRETLRMFSLLRGIPQWRREHFILNISKKLGFEKHLDKQVRTYSGGNKRKLSTSIALLGDPQVVYLDEPTTGMDPAAKRLVWNAISKCQCVILTSHSMEECEALCSRLVIMVNGHPQCLGSPQHLKNKFSQGFTLMIKLRQISHSHDHYEKRKTMMDNHHSILHNFLINQFANATITETCEELVTYYLPDVRIKWSAIFGIMESAKEQLNIEDYSIGQTSLEQIFLKFTKDQKPETKKKNKKRSKGDELAVNYNIPYNI